MKLSLSAGGSPDTVKTALRDQAQAQLSLSPDAATEAVAVAVLDYVDRQLADVSEIVSVSAVVDLHIVDDPVAAVIRNAGEG